MTGFQLKEQIDNIIYFIYNTYSFVSFCFKFKIRGIIGRNVIFKNKHQNQRCFVLGCGPSLKNLTPKQLLFLENEITIGVNELFRASFLKNLTPTYYFMVDNAYWGNDINSTLEAFKAYKHTIFFTNIKAYRVFSPLKKEQLYYLYAKYFPVSRIINRIDKNQTISMNVVTQAINAAMYMGFKDIYLVGCDYTAFATLLDNHCYASTILHKSENLGFYLKYYSLTTQIHYMVAQKAQKENISIFNLTPNSLLDAYPKKQLEEVIKG